MRIEFLDERLRTTLGPALAARGHEVVTGDADLVVAWRDGPPGALILRPLVGLAPARPDGGLCIAPLHSDRRRAAWRPRLHADRLAEAVERWAAGERPATPFLCDDAGASLAYQAGVRLIDAVFVLASALLLPLLPLVVLWIRLDSPGPVLFRQPRVGRDGRTFTCYKLRTMRDGTPVAGTHEVSAAAVTAPGRWLRRLKLDEIPQVANILRGEMSLVGPRPCLPSQTELVTARRARGVLRLRPGITGLSQVEGIDMSDPERLARRDADYAALRCLALDLALVGATLRGGGRGDRTRALR